MSGYQVLSRRYRPQIFKDVVGQDPVVTTLKNAIKFKRLAHAYLFSGSRGTGKTTLARIFAKALNCPHLSPDFEPCGTCSSCKEIASGSSLDVLEIDGASHRGIDDIREINETVGFASASGGYKIYIIDEVHMLTKEAFNALLKTLEEPPEKVKFFFATTEPQKVLPTILSRCQRFNLRRIALEKIIAKLHMIVTELQIASEPEALAMIARRAEGGLRDAESLLDQVISFREGAITTSAVSDVLGIMATEWLYQFDKAGKEGAYGFAFELAHELFSTGKDALHFLDMLHAHFRNILLIKISGKDSSYLDLAREEKESLALSETLYSKEQCLDILDYLSKIQGDIKNLPSLKVALETILLHIMRTHQSIPIEVLVRRLAELEMKLQQPETPKSFVSEKAPTPPEVIVAPQPKRDHIEIKSDLFAEAAPAPEIRPIKVEQKSEKPSYFYDTLMQFAAVELKGKLRRMPNKKI